MELRFIKIFIGVGLSYVDINKDNRHAMSLHKNLKTIKISES